MRFHFPRRKLWLMTLLIWAGAGVLLFTHCTGEAKSVTQDAVRLAAVMEARYLQAAALLAGRRDDRLFKEQIILVGSQYMGYLKELELLEKRLFWKNLQASDGFAAARRKLDAARRKYESALRTLHRPK